MMLMNSNLTNYGTIGERANFRDVKVGDLVSVKFKKNDDYVGHAFSGVVVNHSGVYCVMGACGTKLDLENYEFINKVLPHELVTDEILSHLHNLKKVETKKLTISQVSRLLGYPIEIVQG